MRKKEHDKVQDIEMQLKQAILGSGMSRYKLSKITGVPASVLCTFVNGKRSITIGTAAKLARALGLELRPRKKGR
ncbi:MAG: helix-turn-helix transcriptional regulator [Planctomycetota bacterium]|jgi:plasmid maintenance system antidote protein VapI